MTVTSSWSARVALMIVNVHGTTAGISAHFLPLGLKVGLVLAYMTSYVFVFTF